ncbi:MAG TPA: BadF/BadG/BcrA/BcrD ATPase family protein [Sporolactobacillaceae bacterium]|nr:BadF/BadG/BcrA/BcrD ATPase family protein [Sporolactobacillaceae bacterium]
MKKQFIAIDGGGTKTDLIWFDETGDILKRVKGGAANLNSLSQEQVTSHLNQMFDELVEDHLMLSNLVNVFGGFAGGSHSIVKSTLTSILTHILPRGVEIAVHHDGINALWSGTDGKPGLVLIAGTGSVVFGMTDSGEELRVGGWGHLIGDEGSGYDLGRMAAVAVMKAFDGRGPETFLTPLLLTHFNVEKEADLIPAIYKNPKGNLSAVAPLVADAANQGDAVATEILEQAAEQLIQLVKAGTKQFDAPPHELVFTGGLRHLGDALFLPLSKHLKTLSNNLELKLPEVEPVYGAAVECLRMAGLKPTEKLREALLIK